LASQIIPSVAIKITHPSGLGRPGAESWPETWPIVGQQFENALRGTASWSEDLLLASDRRGSMEECYFTYSHSPLRDATGDVVGVYSAVSETTARVLGERRLRKLRDLSQATVSATARVRPVEEVCQELVDILCHDNPDAPFALLYTALGETLKLCARAGVAVEVPAETRFGKRDEWGIGDVCINKRPSVRPSSVALPGTPWPGPVQEIASLPLLAEHEGTLVGVLVVGVNSRLRLDEAYTDFLTLVASQMAGSISALRSIEKEVRASQLKEVLIRELQHRTRNLLGLVRSISDRTRAASSSLDTYARTFNGRLAALSRVQGLLSADGTRGIGLGELVKLELEPLLDGENTRRVEAEGPPVMLPRSVVQVLSLALHELATNAVKHGALRGGDGTLRLNWNVEKHADDTPRIVLLWRERGLRVSTSVEKSGFGRVLIEKVIPRQLI
jgi:two-component sensor histidine kinase